MNTIGYGKHVAQCSSDAEAAALMRFWRETEHSDWRKRALARIQHGHEFRWWNQCCDCGLSKVAYHDKRPTEAQEVCPLALSRAMGNQGD